jgi:hypothetical protein
MIIDEQLENELVEESPIPATETENQETETEVTDIEHPKSTDVAAMIEALEARIRELEASTKTTPPVNPQSPAVKVSTNMYILQSKELNSWGKIPQQQRDLADIMVKVMEVGKPMSEKDLFDKIVELGAEYPSIATSKQDPTYLFRYYRGLKSKGNHAGFIARDFIKVA